MRLFVILLALAGCAPQQQRYVSAAEAQAGRECDFEAEKAAAGGRTMADRVTDRVFVRHACMRAKGYAP